MKIGSVEIKNRFAAGPLTLPSLYGPYGEFSLDGLAYFEARAKGGFGLIFSGALYPDAEIDPVHPYDSKWPMKAPKEFMRTAKELNERLSFYNAKMFPQISMGRGRNTPGCFAPSPLPDFFSPEKLTPALSRDQVKRKIELVVNGAAFLQSCGFEGAEIHAMHWGYLLDEFAMTMTNQREDEYGGSLENRMRVAKEIAEGIKQVCGTSFALSMRLGLKSYMKDFNKATLTGEGEVGRSLEEGVRIAQMLEAYGYDCLSVDAGVYDSFYYAAPPSYMPKGHVLDLAAAAKKVVTIPILCGSRMNGMGLAENAVKDGIIDAIVLARPSLADSELPKKVEVGCPERIRPCIGCNQNCIGRLLVGGRVGCAVNPQGAREHSFGLEPALQKKKLLVVGGGVAGMELSRTAALRGHQVELHEKSGHLGGRLLPAGVHDFKKELLELNDWYQQELERLPNVEIHLNSALTAEDIAKRKPDVAVLAVGAQPNIPSIPGADGPHVVDAVKALEGVQPIGERVVVIGGGFVACEIAYGYAEEGKHVTIIVQEKDILQTGAFVPLMNGQMLRDLLSYHRVTILGERKILAIEKEGVVTSRISDESQMTTPADTVILSTGFKADAAMAGVLYGSGIEVYEIGDGAKVGNVSSAVTAAYTLARSL